MNNSHDLLTRLFHWIMAIIIVYATIAGYAMHLVIDSHPKVFKFLSIMNMSLATIGALIFPIRFVWSSLKHEKSVNRKLPTLTQRVAKLVHSLIYLLMFLVFSTGFLMLTEPFKLFWLLTIENPVSNLEVNQFFFLLHRISCAALALLVTVHIAAALHHHYILKDTILMKMLGTAPPKHTNPYY